ncbi:MAG: 1,4-alpha-glucan branching protein GlgB [Lachnospiraceae bacterium]|nr:1,4-alpha-glucan branching protein GlgB [Lachnospiraceae bacterium]
MAITPKTNRLEKITVTELDQYLFGQGTHYEIYNKLGAHFSIEDGKTGVFFAVWAPHAKEVFVIGEFNQWNETASPMMRNGEIGIFTCFVPDAREGQLYKYLIITRESKKLFKADPFASYAEIRPGTASKIFNSGQYIWKDSKWIQEREIKDAQSSPMAIYECSIGSWKKHPYREENNLYSYREFADSVIPYLKEMKFTHLELMGIAEYPFEGSWGYQVTGYYAPTSRYGSPDDFRYLIDQLHLNGIGIILDWVPAHFPKDAHGLAEFDGTALFEHPDPRLGEHPDWGTKIFHYGRNEVRNYLIANAIYWVKEFHIDGLRVDAVASMLYLDYGKEHGNWVPNKYGGNRNLDAIEFFKHLNSVIIGMFPGVVTIAEESTAWPGVTKKPEEDGLGFSFKWNMGWMHDFCEYMKLDPYFRKNNHHAMTFSMSYNESENYILPLSHDEVVHLKCSMLNKMPGLGHDKFDNLRVGYTFMIGHCGKKLLFMGQEFAQLSEWNEETQLEWELLENPLHSGMKKYVQELLTLYNQYPCLYQHDNSWKGFEWINVDDRDKSTYSFFRKDDSGKNSLLFVFNFTPIERPDYRIGVPTKGKYKLILNSDDKKYGGSGKKQPKEITAEHIRWDHREYSIPFALPSYGAAVFLFQQQ